MDARELFLEDVAAGLWNDTEYHYHEWLESNGYSTEYFDLTVADGISGDDLNRRLREKRLGFGPPFGDWSKCKAEIRCLWAGQTITKRDTLTGRMYIYSTYFNGLKERC